MSVDASVAARNRRARARPRASSSARTAPSESRSPPLHRLAPPPRHPPTATLSPESGLLNLLTFFKIVIAAYHMLSSNKPYQDLTDAYLDKMDESRTTNNLVRRLERLGYNVQLERKAA